MEYKKYAGENYNVYTIKTDKFKNCHMEVIFRNEVIKEELTKRAFLCDILMRSSKKYPTRSLLAIEYENLYNTFIYGVTSRIGNSIFTNYCLDFLNPKYTDKSIVKNAIELIFELIQNPNIENNEFQLDNFNIVKNNLRADILAQRENAIGYAIRRMLFNLDETSPCSYNVNGYLADLEEITQANLVDFYHNVMNSDSCDIYVIGNLDMDKVFKIIQKNFKCKSKKSKLQLYYENKKSSSLKIINEQDKFKQASLIVGCNIDTLTEREKNIVFQLYNVILGVGSLETKLIKYLREDNSLCYQTYSMYQKYDRILIIYAGINAENYNLAVKLIKKCLKEMESGKISDKELENARLLIKSSLNMASDSPASLINNYVFQTLDNLPSIEERVKAIDSVTKEEVIAVAKKVNINTIYMLSNEEAS